MIVRCLLAALGLLAVAACAGPQPQLTLTEVSDIPNDVDHGCGGNYMYMLTIVDGGQEVAKERECVEFVEDFSAKVFKDRHGHMYVFIVDDSAHGTGEPPQALTIRRVDADHRMLYDVAWLQMTSGDITGQGLGWDVTYAVDQTDSDSLRVVITYAASADGAQCCTPPEKQVIVRLGSLAAGGSMPARAAPEAVVRPAPPEKWCNGQGFGIVTMAVTDGGHMLAHDDECQSPGETFSAQSAVDQRGRIYMLLRTHSPTLDSASRNASDTLSVYELEALKSHAASYHDPYVLTWMGDLLLSPAEDPGAQWPATYHVRDTKGGGLEVIVDYSSVKDDGCCRPPERQMSLQLGP